MADYSFSPQFANLSGLQPLPALDVTRGAALQFQPLQAIQIQSSRPELVAEGIAGAVSNIAQGALSGITAKYEKEEEKEKEKRKYGYELLLEQAKQKTKNEQFLDELILKTTAEQGASANLPKIISSIRSTAERLNYVNPSGRSKAELSPQKPSIDSDFVTQTPVEQPEQPTTYFVDKGSPKDGALRVDMQTPLPETEPAPPPSVDVVPPSDGINIPDPNFKRVSTQVQPPALAGIPSQPAAEPAPTPVLAKVQAIGSYKLPEQPTDPKAPRNTAGIEFEPDESAKAYEAAAKLITPYWKIIPEKNPTTDKWTLRPEDTSGDVEKRGIDKENLVLAQNKQALEREKADRDRLDAETKKLKEDKQYLDTQKNQLDTTLVNVDFIDQAIYMINEHPEAVGVLSDIYRKGEPLPIIGDVAGWRKLLAFAGDKYSEKILQDILNVAEALDQVKKNIGFEKLAELKSLSPTGASGLGSLTQEERQALEKTAGSIEQAQTKDILENRLYTIRSGVIKSAGNAFMKIREVEPKYVPIQTLQILEMNPNEVNELKKLTQTLKSAKDKESAEYKKDIKRFKNLIDKSARIDAFNTRVFPTE